MGYDSRHGMKDRRVLIDYTNWRGERDWRTVEPVGIFFGSNEWHKEKQWLMYARVDGVVKTFALAMVHKWEVMS